MSSADKEADDALRRMRPPTGEPMDDGVLLAFLAGNLDDEARAEVELELDRNGAARNQLLLLSRARQGLGESDIAAAEAAFPSTKRAWLPWAGAAIAAAAALIFWIAQPVPPEVAWRVDGPNGGVRVARATDAPARSVFVPQSELRIDLIPAAETAGKPVSVYVLDPSGKLEARVVTATRSPAGAVQVSGTAASLFDRRFGERKLWIVLAAPVNGLAGSDPARLAESDGLVFPFELDYRATITPQP